MIAGTESEGEGAGFAANFAAGFPGAGAGSDCDRADDTGEDAVEDGAGGLLLGATVTSGGVVSGIGGIDTSSCLFLPDNGEVRLAPREPD